MARSKASRPAAIKQPPTIVSVLLGIETILCAINRGIATPFDCNRKKNPKVTIPPINTNMKDQIVTAGHHFTIKKNSTDSSTADTDTTTRINQPTDKSYTHCPIWSKLRLKVD